MNFYQDSPEWRALFKNGIDWDNIIPLYHPAFPTSDGFNTKEELIAFYQDLISATGKWAGETVAPRARELDRTGGGTLVNDKVEISEPLRQTYREAAELGVFGLCIDPRHGGLGTPTAVGLITFQQLARACVATSTQIGFFGIIADMIERFCPPEFREKYIPLIQRGELSGSMCMTEPHAGSDVGMLRTSAKKQPDGTYLLNGTKCFITNAGGGVAFILARVEGAPAGLEGISMFFSEEWIGEKHNYRVTKVEEKMGFHGSPTCEVVYEDTVAHLVGNEGDGFKMMLHLMNEARISVGLQGLGIMESALDEARRYAETRVQFGKPIIELPLLARHFQDWETERDAFRALMVDTVSHYDIFQRLDLKKRHAGELTEQETSLFKKASKVVRRRTPLVKYYGAEACALISQRAIQVFGGYGYMKEYEVERIHRDSFGSLLYEGTSQIQALMAMKDFVKETMKNPSKFMQSLVVGHPIGSLLGDPIERSLNQVNYEFQKNFAALLMRCFKPELNISENGFKETITQINQVFRREYWQEANRFDKLMVHAETLTQALAFRETLKVLAKHSAKDASRADLYHRYAKLVGPRLQGIYADWAR